MPVSLGQDNRVSIPPSVLVGVSDLTPSQTEHVQTQLLQITEAGYTPRSFQYKHYGDLSVFRCGDVIRIFGVILENLTYISDFDNIVIVLEISEHDYDSAGVSRQQAQDLQERYANINSEEDFYDELNGELLDSSDIEQLI